MQTQATRNKVEKFEPIDLTIKIESQRELEVLVQLFGNTTADDLSKVCMHKCKYKNMSYPNADEIRNVQNTIFNILYKLEK